MKRSEKLYRYLQQHQALDNPRTRHRLKREYRRKYQNNWARQQRKKKREIRFSLKNEEYQIFKSYCQKHAITPTALARDLVLSQSQSQPFLANKEELLKVAKEIGLAINRIQAEGNTEITLRKLLSAEATLLSYLKNYSHAYT
jgi:CRISPR/Cas system CSM-associated protein Csm3 (group 7 of RAMP superfamily)